jgi:N-acetylmuramoyl-L-alanine amidase
MEPTREQLENAIKNIAVMFHARRKDDLDFNETDIAMILVELGYVDNDPDDEDVLDYVSYPTNHV